MCKKILMVGAAGLLAAAVLTQTHVGNWVSYQFHKGEKYLENKVPPEEELRQIKSEVASLDKDIDKARGSVAEEIVEAKLLKTKVDDRREAVKASRTRVETRAAAIKDAGDNKLVTWDSRKIPYDRAKEMLQSEVTSHKALEKDLQNQETMLGVRERTRDLAQEHLQALIAQKSELEAAVTELEADIKLAKIEQVQSKYQNDGTRMAEVKERLANLKKRVEVQRTKLNLAKQYDKTSVDNKSVDEIMAELDAKTETTAHK
jgi:peptidoglycan hydrolase CwlO-like protein